MKPVKQRFRHCPAEGLYGDCHRAAIATVLELDIEDVPHFGEGNPPSDVFHAKVRDFLAGHGLRIVDQIFSGELADILHTVGMLNGPDLIYLLGGTSRTGTHHTVVCQGSAIVWDPSEEASGIVGPCDEGFYWVSIFSPINLLRSPNVWHVRRDRAGRIAGVAAVPFKQATEMLPEHHPEIAAFFAQPQPASAVEA